MPALGDPDVATNRTATRSSVPSRRSVLRVAAAAGAAGIAATALGGVIAPASAAASARLPHAAPDESAGTEPLVLHVRDAAAGEIDVFRGTTHTRLHDRDLATRIVLASR
ncbi:MAG TPA: hypothetical protein VMU94_27040 [Streptosporangiaceae bacterium]|nr:hypothetical protein [Streptosporangiaceae bacterium]